jgi:hypothetical protein
MISPMLRLAPGVFQLRGFPPNTINVYLVGAVLVDAGTPSARLGVWCPHEPLPDQDRVGRFVAAAAHHAAGVVDDAFEHGHAAASSQLSET